MKNLQKHQREVLRDFFIQKDNYPQHSKWGSWFKFNSGLDLKIATPFFEGLAMTL